MKPAEYLKRAHKLPRWAQEYINALHDEIGGLKTRVVAQDRELSCVAVSRDESYVLFRLKNDEAEPLINVEKGDILFVSRAKGKKP